MPVDRLMETAAAAIRATNNHVLTCSAWRREACCLLQRRLWEMTTTRWHKGKPFHMFSARSSIGMPLR